MKVALDENIPLGIVTAFRALAKEGTIKGFEFVSAREYSEDHEKDDVPWIKRFAADGGRIIVSGDKRMRARLHERDALASAGMIVFFFTSAWWPEARVTDTRSWKTSCNIVTTCIIFSVLLFIYIKSMSLEGHM